MAIEVILDLDGEDANLLTLRQPGIYYAKSTSHNPVKI